MVESCTVTVRCVTSASDSAVAPPENPLIHFPDFCSASEMTLLLLIDLVTFLLCSSVTWFWSEICRYWCAYFSGMLSRLRMFLICWKWNDMSVASTISITRARNSLPSSSWIFIHTVSYKRTVLFLETFIFYSKVRNFVKTHSQESK